MNAAKTHADLVERRATLMAELFLEDLGAKYVGQPESESMPFDYLAGFSNSHGGVNTLAVVLKATERPIAGHHAISKRLARAIANSNLPVMLLVIDAKQNQLWFAWGVDVAAQAKGSADDKSIMVDLHQVTDETKSELKTELTRSVRAAS